VHAIVGGCCAILNGLVICTWLGTCANTLKVMDGVRVTCLENHLEGQQDIFWQCWTVTILGFPSETPSGCSRLCEPGCLCPCEQESQA